MIKKIKPRSVSAQKRHLKHQSLNSKPANSLIGKNSAKWTFSKANRFNNKVQDQNPPYVNLKSSFGVGRKAAFGFGRRWQPSNARGQDAPPPTKYSVSSKLYQSTISCKFSVPKSKNIRNKWSSPGPGSYELASCIGKGVSCSLKSRHSRPARQSTPPPGTYNPRHSLVESGRYSSISFGIRTSSDNLYRDLTPGPGSYELCKSVNSVSNSVSPLKPKKRRKNSL